MTDDTTETVEHHAPNGQHPDDPGPAEPSTEPDRPLFPPPSAPLDVARQLYAQYRDPDDLRTLLSWRGGFMRWETTHWSELDPAALRADVYRILGSVDYKHPIREKGVIIDYEVRPWSPDRHKVANVIEAMAAVGHLSTTIDPPAWIEKTGTYSAAARSTQPQLISCTNGLLDVKTRQRIDHTPAWFNVVSVPFDYEAGVSKPVEWLAFLDSIWPGDAESVALLQEYMGYVLSGRTNQQKLLLLIGPPRSGKGTIARILTQLIGRGHVAAPTLASLGTNFGLSPLLGKPLAIISDARLGDTPAHVVVERLLSITGEDMMTVDRKFRDPWSGKLPTRFVVLSNELPKFHDSSQAIANRMVILQATKSFLGKEDLALEDKLHPELPGILVWALEGLDRLSENGRFTVPAASADATALMMDMASPMSAFVRGRCLRKSDQTVTIDDLYRAWKVWADENGHQAGSKSTFGRNLRAVVPEIKVSQPTINDRRIQTYTCIGLLPLHPLHDDGPQLCRGCGAAGSNGNTLVSGLCRRCRGETPLHIEEELSAGDPVARCPCGNELLTVDSINSGKCKPCRSPKGDPA